MSKGSVQRPDGGAYRDSYDRIFLGAKPIEFGDLMTLGEFVARCLAGLFIDYDGNGHYSDGEVRFTKRIINPSDVTNGDIDTSFSHVVWYNR